MTTSESSPSVHLQCLKNCLSDKLSTNHSPENNLKNNSLTDTDPSKSPTNNNNNNYSAQVSSSNSGVITYNSGSNNSIGLSSQSVPNVYGSSPSNSNSTICSNSCCSNKVGFGNTTSSPGTLASGAESSELSIERDSTGEKECPRNSLKISENHLSTKLIRSTSSPYPIPNSTTKGVSLYVKQNQDKSNHSQENSSVQENVTSMPFMTPIDEEDQVMFDNVNSIQLNHHNGVLQQGNSSNINLETSSNIPNLMGSTSILTSGISSNGVILANNMVMKHEPNGNSIELSLLDNQFFHHRNHLQSFQQHQSANQGSDCGVNNPSRSPLLGGDNHVGMQPHETFLGNHNNPHNGSIQNNQLCHNGLFSNSCVHMSLVTGNGSIGSISGNSCGAGSMTSPGGSLDEHDCDDDKVINGDTFGSGELPDPDAIKMFVGQIPKHLSESELRTLFEEFGRVFQINVLRDKVTKQSKGCCFVTFFARKSALESQNALHNVKTLPGMNHPIQMKPADNENRYERKLFVGMLSRKCNEADVRNMFSRHGVIDECTVLRDTNGQSKGCAFVTFASKTSAQNAIKAVHHSMTMEGCSSPIVVKFADTQKDKDQKKQQQIQATLLGNISPAASVAPLSQPYFSELLKLEQILQQFQQQQQQQQQANYFSQLSPMGIQSLSGLSGLSSSVSASGIPGLTSAQTSQDLATLTALANLTNGSHTQHQLAIGVQNLATLAANLGNHSSLSPTDYTYSGANGCSLGSSSVNALALTGTALQQSSGTPTRLRGLGSFSMRNQQVSGKQTEGPEGANLFIYHLPPEFGDTDLAQMFTPYGTVISAKVFVDKHTNLSKCFGFVSFDNPVSAQLAIGTMNGFQIGMKRLKVQLKRSKEAAKPY